MDTAARMAWPGSREANGMVQPAVEPSLDEEALTPGDERPVLAMEHVSKQFGATLALDDVSLELRRGEIHALLGENGAGKSTLIKIMTGVQRQDSGEIRIAGAPVRVTSSQDAQRLGVAAIYQEPMIFPDLSVAENIFIGHRDRGKIVDRRRMEREAREVLARLDVRLDVGEPARGLTLAEQQTFEIANRVTILRDGRWISTTPRAELTPATAISRMVGREVRELFRRERRQPGAVRLSVRGLRREGAFQDVSFDLRAGEVLGFAGLVGARRTDIGLALFGIAPADGGEIELDGTRVSVTSPRDAMALGIAYSTEDRRQLGLVMPLSIAANVSLPSLPRFLTPAGMVRRV